MQPIEKEGRSVTEAVEIALKENGLRRDQVEVTVIESGTPGFLGIGSKLARIRLTEKRWGPESPASPPAAKPVSARRTPRPQRPPAPPPAAEAVPVPKPPSGSTSRLRDTQKTIDHPLTPEEAAAACAKAQDIVLETLRLMSIAAPTAESSWDAALERVKVSVETQDAPLLVGRDGRVLESLQLLVTLMLNRGALAPIAVQVDALSYWEKRETTILDQARLAIESAKATGKPVRLEPMDSSMRRLIHRTFASRPDITTSSEGEGPWRKIVIRAKPS